ncbi:MAG: pyruvate kinase [Desulfurococcales archaeon]|nr:pyruvate kinase [Desulfurococcales archaeon]
MAKTKIIVTIGPASGDKNIIKAFLREGIAGFRINFSHGSPSIWDKYLEYIEYAEKELDVYPAIIGDLTGPQLRIGEFKAFGVKKGDRVKLVYAKESDEEKTIPVFNRKIFDLLDPGDIVLLDDGKIRLHVEEANIDYASLVVLNDGFITPRKTILIAGKDLGLPVLTRYDVECVRYAVSRNFTYLALSYVRYPRDIYTLRELLAKLRASHIGIIAKIETRSAIKNLSQVVREADAVIIARGDLGMHYSLEEIPRLQKLIITKSIEIGKPVIVATQLLESLVNNPQPTRSEVVDVINAVNDSVDALLLTSETAMGRYPIEAVKWLKRIIRVAEQWSSEGYGKRTTGSEELDIRDKYAKGLVSLAENISSKVLIYTKTGTMPSKIAKYRPEVPVYVGSSSKHIVRKLSIYRGLNPVHVAEADESTDYEEGLNKLYKQLLDKNEITYGDVIVLTYGRRETTLHVIKIIQVL